MKSLLLVVLGALLCTAGTRGEAQPAAERRFYAGVDLGEARINRDWPDIFFTPGQERESPAWKVRFGYQFTPRFSLETAYTDFGDYRGAGIVIMLPGAPTPPVIFAPGEYRTSAKGIELSAVGTWPVGERFYLSASAGIIRREMKSRYDATLPLQPGFRARDGDLGMQLGAGAGFKLNDVLDLGINWVGTRKLDGDARYFENASDPSLMSLGLRVRF